MMQRLVQRGTPFRSMILSKWSKRFISSANLTIEQTTDKTRFQNKPKQEDLTFGTTMSDHMLTIEWDSQNKWGTPKIVPFADLRISPAAS